MQSLDGKGGEGDEPTWKPFPSCSESTFSGNANGMLRPLDVSVEANCSIWRQKEARSTLAGSAAVASWREAAPADGAATAIITTARFASCFCCLLLSLWIAGMGRGALAAGALRQDVRVDALLATSIAIFLLIQVNGRSVWR